MSVSESEIGEEEGGIRKNMRFIENECFFPFRYIEIKCFFAIVVFACACMCVYM